MSSARLVDACGIDLCTHEEVLAAYQCRQRALVLDWDESAELQFAVSAVEAELAGAQRL